MCHHGPRKGPLFLICKKEEENVAVSLLYIFVDIQIRTASLRRAFVGIFKEQIKKCQSIANMTVKAAPNDEMIHSPERQI